MIVTDYVPRTPMDASNINSHILFGMTGRSVVTTVCNGKVLMKDRELIGIDEEKVLYEVREEAKKLERSIKVNNVNVTVQPCHLLVSIFMKTRTATK